MKNTNENYQKRYRVFDEICKTFKRYDEEYDHDSKNRDFEISFDPKNLDIELQCKHNKSFGKTDIDLINSAIHPFCAVGFVISSNQKGDPLLRII